MSTYDPFEFVGVYGMTKAALSNLSISLSKELREDNIRVNSIAPGMIHTEALMKATGGGYDPNSKGVGKPS